jgi:hypothetical protein
MDLAQIGWLRGLDKIPAKIAFCTVLGANEVSTPAQKVCTIGQIVAMVSKRKAKKAATRVREQWRKVFPPSPPSPNPTISTKCQEQDFEGDTATIPPSAKSTGEVFGLTNLEVSLILILWFIQVALPMMGVQQNFWWGLVIWTAIACLAVRIVWKWEITRRLTRLKKLLTSIFLLTAIGVVIYKPLSKTFYLTVRPSFILMMPGEELVDCERRAFVVKHRGARVLPNPDIVLLDNGAKNGLAKQYPEVTPGAPDLGNPKYLWWNPANPWREDYTFTITSGEQRAIQRLFVTSAKGKLQRATEISVNGKMVFACRDSLLPFSYTLASGAQPCDALDIPQEITNNLEPSHFSVQKPDGSIVVQTMRKPSPKPGVEGQSESRHLWEYQKIQMVRGLSYYRGAKITLLASGAGTDTWKYAEELGDVLRRAKWSVAGPTKLSDEYDGLLDIQLSSDNVTPPRQEATALLDALVAAGIKHRSNYVLDAAVAPGMIVLWVGSRSPDEITSDDCPGVALHPPTNERDRPCVMIAAAKHTCPFPPP